jgi:hypothetical protein
MLIKNTVAHTLRELPAVFHAIDNASRKTLGGDCHSTDILSLTGQASPTCGKETIKMSRRDRMLVETRIIEAIRPVRDEMLVKNTVAHTLRELPAVFHVIDNASRKTLGGDCHSTDILSLTGQASPTCGKETKQMSRRDEMLVETRIIEAIRPVRDEMLVKNTVARTLRELPAAFHAIGSASRKTLGGDYVSTDILSLTGQTSPTCGKETIKMSRRDRMLVETRIIEATRPVRDEMLIENTVTHTLRELPAVFHVIDSASRKTLGGDYVSTDILSLTGQASPTCGKETKQMSRGDRMLVKTQIIEATRPVRDEMLAENNTVAHTLRELPAVFHAIDNASRKTLGGDYVSTDILSLTGQASPTCGKETNQMSRRDRMLVETRNYRNKQIKNGIFLAVPLIINR